MKKILVIPIVAAILSGCGVGSYTVSSGRADECAISFTSAKSLPIAVMIDGNEFKIKSVKSKAYKKDRKIKQTAKNTIRLSPGTHDVKVMNENKTIYSHKVFVSAAEHRIVEL